MGQNAKLRWLGDVPARPTGVTWGLCWPRGELRVNEGVHVENPEGQAVPTQTWPLAYWPDGSVKWLGMTAVFGPSDKGELRVAKGAGPTPAIPVTVQQLGIEIFKRVGTGPMTADVGDRGVCILQEVTRDGRTVGGAASLVCRLQGRAKEGSVDLFRIETCLGVVKKLTVEQTGPVRATIRLEGAYRGEASGREWLPFVLRLVFYAGVDTIEMQHTFIYDGKQEEDFIAGLGLRVHVPLLDTVENRHVRYAGAGGTWCEPANWTPCTTSSAVRQIHGAGTGSGITAT